MAEIKQIIKSALKGSFKSLRQPAQPPAIQSLWIGKELTVMERMCISSFLNNGHDYVLYVYGHVNHIPPGTTVKDANDIIHESEIFKYSSYDSYAGFSDMFRYKLLYEKGGYWVDTDIFCLKPFPFEKRYLFASQRNMTGKIKVNCCVMKAPAKSRLMAYCYKESIAKDPATLKWAEMGPILLTKAVTQFKMWDDVSGPEAFCPIEWWKWDRLITESDMNVFNGSLAVHCWNEMWRRNNADKSIRYKDNCLYEQLQTLGQRVAAPADKT
ncbi:MAG: glycosyltransferase [Acidobacteriota bacterium]